MACFPLLLPAPSGCNLGCSITNLAEQFLQGQMVQSEDKNVIWREWRQQAQQADGVGRGSVCARRIAE